MSIRLAEISKQAICPCVAARSLHPGAPPRTRASRAIAARAAAPVLRRLETPNF
jgi:hypothetical protein